MASRQREEGRNETLSFPVHWCPGTEQQVGQVRKRKGEAALTWGYEDRVSLGKEVRLELYLPDHFVAFVAGIWLPKMSGRVHRLEDRCPVLRPFDSIRNLDN